FMARDSKGFLLCVAAGDGSIHRGQGGPVCYTTAVPVYPHHELPASEVPRIRTRILCGPRLGAVETAIWQQWIEPDGFIPLHYHEVEEVLLITAGTIELTLEDTVSRVTAPATVLVPAMQLHSLRPAGEDPVELLAFFPVANPSILDPDGVPRPMPWDDHETLSAGD
ncbi:MAG: cupin domain-containing protein, partial [Pirellulaceae bacterium]|nr:cupin domain-containing protein [Pirellulaceae bacterium]